MQMKLSKVIASLSSYFNNAAPIGLIIDSYKRRYEDETRLASKLQTLLETEIDYEGPLFTEDDINQLPQITVNDLTTIDFLIKDW